VSAAAGQAAKETATKVVVLEVEARARAAEQRDFTRAGRIDGRLFEAPSFARSLERARRHLAAGSPGSAPLPKAAEWFLDNY
jgi:hypothetical protein